MTLKIIGFSGNSGSGKDTAYQLLSAYSVRTKECNAIFHRAAFADALKKACAAAFGIPLESFYGTFEERSEIHSPWNISARQAAQFMGTEMFRDTIPKLCPHIGSNFWIARLEKDLSTYAPETIHCITDVRFQNEANWICNKGGLIIHLKRIGATGNVGIQDHASEAGYLITREMKGHHYEVRNDGTKDELLNTILTPIQEHFNLF